MATLYVRSTDGSDADNGTTWALAKATLAGAAAIDAAGDRIWVSQVHAESTAGNVTVTLAGTLALPTMVCCGTDSAAPPITYDSSATVTVTGANNLVLDGNAWFQGITFTGGATLQLGNGAQVQFYENCVLALGEAGAGDRIVLTASAAQAMQWAYTTVSFTHASQYITTNSNRLVWRGGGAAVGTTTPSFLFDASANGDFKLDIDSCDFSEFSAGFDFVQLGGLDAHVKIRNCVMPTSWSGTIFTASPAGSEAKVRGEMWNCDAYDTSRTTQLRIEDWAGIIVDESTIVRSDGYDDGTNQCSWKMTTGTNVNYPLASLVSPDMALMTRDRDENLTVTVEFLHDSVTDLQDDEIWLEVEYLWDNISPQGRVADTKAQIVTTPTDITNSTKTWTTTGLTNPNKQKLEIVLTPARDGYVRVRVHLAKPSYTIYLDPRPAMVLT